MSESTGTDDVHDPADEHEEQKQEIADVEEQLDEQSDGEGLGAEAGNAEETGISQG